MKEYLKYVIPGILGLIAIIVLVFLANSFSCISAPEKIQGEPAVCRDAKYIAYAFHRNEKVPETVISNGLASCRNQQIWNFCTDAVSGITEPIAKGQMFQQCWDKNKQQ